MQRIYQLTILLSLIVLGAMAKEGDSCTAFVIGEPEAFEKEGFVEKVKNVSFQENLEEGDVIYINNNFGDVKVKYWGNPKVQFNVSVVSNATSAEKAQNFIDAVSFENGKEANKAFCKTKMECSKVKSSDNVDDGLKKEDNYLKVNYFVLIPKGYALDIKNAYGDVFLPDSKSPVTLRQKHGVLYANALQNSANDLEICYGKAYIKHLQGGELKANQTALKINKASDLALFNKMGDLQLKEAENVSFMAKYTSGYVGQLRKSCKFTIEFSEDFQIGIVDDGVEDFELVTSYADVEFPLCRKSKFNMTVSTTNTNMEVLHSQAAKSLDCQKKKNIQKTISIGEKDIDASNIVILANHGNVRIK